MIGKPAVQSKRGCTSKVDPHLFHADPYPGVMKCSYTVFDQIHTDIQSKTLNS
jgi:hypothetical protein